MNKRRDATVKAQLDVNPLWVIAVAMAIFFAAVAAVIALA
jgi:hypothetical protein